MKELQFAYRLRLSFDAPVCRHRFTLKCVPRTDACQRISDLHVEVYPREFLSEDEDSFGNFCIFGYSEHEHDHFLAQVEGTARTGLAACLPAQPLYKLGMYRCQTDYTRPGPELEAFARDIYREEKDTNLTRAERYMDALYARFRYVQGVTDITTTAEQAFALGEGVCQDYAHILLSLCRRDGIPCRYVVGMLVGEGESHAWVEVYHEGGWYALDPTNHLRVTDQHIRISAGRDYRDCLLNHGIFTGTAQQSREIAVQVFEKS